jgi:cell division protein ZapB
LTALIFCNYSVDVEAELKSLEEKLNQMIELCQRLRSDNQELRQQLAAAMDQTKRLEEKITSAMSRLEGLLSQMPAEDEA